MGPQRKESCCSAAKGILGKAGYSWREKREEGKRGVEKRRKERGERRGERRGREGKSKRRG